MADDAQETGGMIALVPRAQDCEAMAVRGGEAVDQLHLTLCYLGDDVTEWTAAAQNLVAGQVAMVASRFGPIEARSFATATFNPDGFEGRKPCAVFLVGDADQIVAMRVGVVPLMADIPPQHSPFTPHITIGYGLKADKLGPVGPVVFDRLRLALADKVYDFPLGEEKALLMEFFEWKKKFTAADGGFGKKPAEGDTAPKIQNEADLKTACGAWRKSKSPKLRSHIMGRAKALDLTVPDDVKSAGAKGLFEGLSDVEISAIIEQKVMSPDPHAAQLREYWAHGGGVKKWRPGSPGDFKRLRRHLAKYVHSPHVLDGLTANIHKLATGEWPGPHAHGGGKKDALPLISAEEIKAAVLLSDPDADLNPEALASLFSEDDEPGDDSDNDGDEDFDDEIDPYEQGLIDDVDWELAGQGELVRDDDGETGDEAENFEDDEEARVQAPAGPYREVSLWD